MAGLLSGIGNMFSSFFHPEKGYEEAEKEFRRAWEESRGRQQPFVDQGQAQYGNLMGAEGALLDPESLLGKWIKGYEMSPYAKQSFENAKSAGLDSASSQGLLGSSAALNNIQSSASNIMNADRSQYLNDLMQKYLAGVGIGQNIYGIGANTAGELGREGLEYGRDIAGTRYGAENAPGNLLGNLIKLGADIYTGGKGGYFNNPGSLPSASARGTSSIAA